MVNSQKLNFRFTVIWEARLITFNIKITHLGDALSLGGFVIVLTKERLRLGAYWRTRRGGTP
jgi:hypothetical protein